ncbi:MAG: hypothetical protein Q9166_004214 [cf. Caloplaca sp. 2 TL-2023]
MTGATGIKNLVSCFVEHCQGSQAVTVRFHTGFGFSYSGDCRPSEHFVRIGKDSTVLVHEATFDDEMQGDAKAKKHTTMSEAIGVASAMGAKRLILTHFSQRYQKLPNLGALDNIEVQFEEPVPSQNVIQDIDYPTDPEPTDVPTNTYDQLPGESISIQQQTEARSTPPSSLGTSPPSSPTRHQLKIAIAFDFLRVRVGDIAYIEKFTPSVQRLFEILEQDEKAKAHDNPGEVARRKKEEQKKEKRETQMRIERENKEAKQRKKGSFRRLRRNTDADKEGYDVAGTEDRSLNARTREGQRRNSGYEQAMEDVDSNRIGVVEQEPGIVP